MYCTKKFFVGLMLFAAFSLAPFFGSQLEASTYKPTGNEIADHHGHFGGHHWRHGGGDWRWNRGYYGYGYGYYPYYNSYYYYPGTYYYSDYPYDNYYYYRYPRRSVYFGLGF